MDELRPEDWDDAEVMQLTEAEWDQLMELLARPVEIPRGLEKLLKRPDPWDA